MTATWHQLWTQVGKVPAACNVGVACWYLPFTVLCESQRFTQHYCKSDHLALPWIFTTFKMKFGLNGYTFCPVMSTALFSVTLINCVMYTTAPKPFLPGSLYSLFVPEILAIRNFSHQSIFTHYALLFSPLLIMFAPSKKTTFTLHTITVIRKILTW